MARADHRQEFVEQGYTVFDRVLDSDPLAKR